MNDAFNNFVEQLTDPYVVLFCALVTGYALGWLSVMLGGAADEVFRYFSEKRIARAAKRSVDRKEDLK